MAERFAVRIMPRAKAEAYAPGKNECCISIGSPGQALANLSSHFRDTLRLQFHDLAGFQREDGSWPDGSTQLVEDDADMIAEFVARNRDMEALVVHCEAGISRSVAVGLAISTEVCRHWAWPEYMPTDYRRNRYVHNRHVFDVVVAALQRHGLSTPAPVSPATDSATMGATKGSGIADAPCPPLSIEGPTT